MPTKQLDFIATTSPADRQYVMPRIHCEDGISLSVQASIEHFSRPFTSVGPWTELEVAFLSSGVEAPSDWMHASHGELVFELHDHTGIQTKRMIDGLPSVYVVPVEKLRAFIESHGGEVETDEIGRLQIRIEVLQEEQNRKWAELEVARKKECAIWDERVKPILARVQGMISEDEGNRIAFKKIKNEYEAAAKDANRLHDELSALLERSIELSNRCRKLIDQRNEAVSNGYY